MSSLPALEDPAAPAPGLTEAEARERLAAEGPNELSRERRPGLLAATAAVLKEPMLLLLLGAGGIYLLLGDVREALTLLSFVIVAGVLSVALTALAIFTM